MKNPAEARVAKAPRWAWALALLALTAPFWSLSHPLIEVDDARYAEVPREMLATGDWATPHLDYMDYVEKPPLWYWLCASSYKAFGVGEAQARLPLALLAALGLILTAWLGSWLYDARSGLLGAAALGSTGLFFFLSHYITLDLLLTVTLLAETAFILRCLLRPHDARWAAPAAWVAAALAFLSKGLVALVLPGAWVVALFVLWPKRRRAFLPLLSPLGIALFAIIALPWFWLMERRHPGFLRFIFLEQHFQRFTTAKYNRQSPFWFFLAVLPAGLLPWAPAALASLARAPRRWLEREGDAALAAWAVIVTGFFSVSHSKLATYILPVVPHLALLAARAADDELPAWSRWFSSLLGAALLGAAALAPRLPQVPRELLPWAPAGAAALGAGLLAGGLVRSARWRVCALTLGGLGIGVCLLGVLRRADGRLTVKPVAQAIALQAAPTDEVWVYNLYPHGLSFYLGRRVDKIVNWLGELEYAKRDPANAARFGDDNDVQTLPLPGKRTFVALPAKDARQFISLTPQGAISDHGQFGKWEMTAFVPEEQLPRLRERPQPSDELPGTRRRRRRRRR